VNVHVVGDVLDIVASALEPVPGASRPVGAAA